MLITKEMCYFFAAFQNLLDILAVVELVPVCLFAGVHIEFLAKGTVVRIAENGVDIRSRKVEDITLQILVSRFLLCERQGAIGNAGQSWGAFFEMHEPGVGGF